MLITFQITTFAYLSMWNTLYSGLKFYLFDYINWLKFVYHHRKGIENNFLSEVGYNTNYNYSITSVLCQICSTLYNILVVMKHIMSGLLQCFENTFYNLIIFHNLLK